MVVLVAISLPALDAQAQIAPIADDQCTFPIRSWKMASSSMFPTLAPDQDFWAICMAHTLRDSGVPADSLQLAVGSHVIRQGDVVLVQISGLFGPKFVTPRRVIGLPGDRVQVDGDVLRLNGSIVNRVREGDATVTDSQISEKLHLWRETLADSVSYRIALEGGRPPRASEGADGVVVPDGSLYVLGDNRHNSVDSRIEKIGPIRFHDVMGVVAQGDQTLETIVGGTLSMILLGQIKPR